MIPEPRLEPPETIEPQIREIQPQPWWTKEITKRSVETAQEELCDHYCKWPSEYKDTDDLWDEKCDRCPIIAFFDEVSTCLKQE